MALPTFPSGVRVRASDLTKLIPTAPVEGKDTSVADGTTTSLTYVNSLTTTGIRGVTFKATDSGRIEILWSCGGRNSVAGQFSISSVEVRAGTTIGSGAVWFAGDENTAVAPASDSAGHQTTHAGFVEVTGLTPGADYNASLIYRTSAGTATFSRRRISVKFV